ncbi:MAG: tetratricopeptide repeat protein, partial [Nitrospirota bacterium]
MLRSLAPSRHTLRLLTLCLAASLTHLACVTLPRSESAAAAHRATRPLGAPSPTELFLIGDYQSRHGDPKAIETFKGALRLDPASPDLLTALATAYRREGQVEMAQVAARDALKHDPDQEEALQILYELHTHAHAYDEALPYLKHLYELDPENTQRLAQLAQLYLETGRSDEAIAVLEGYLADHPASVVAHFHLGRIYGAVEQFDKAADHFRRCTEERPDVERGWINLGAALEQGGDLDGAIQAYQGALDLNPYNHALSKRVAQLLVTTDKLTEAVAAYEKLIADNPEDLHSQLRLALLLFDQREFARALDRLQRIHQRWPHNDRVEFFLGLAYEQTEQHAEAVQHFQELYAADPTNLEVAQHLIANLEPLGDVAPLMEIFAQARIAAEPISVDLIVYLGGSLVRMEALTQAEEVFQEGVRLYPQEARLYFQLGALYEKMKRYPEAYDALEQSIELDPEQ